MTDINKKIKTTVLIVDVETINKQIEIFIENNINDISKSVGVIEKKDGISNLLKIHFVKQIYISIIKDICLDLGVATSFIDSAIIDYVDKSHIFRKIIKDLKDSMYQTVQDMVTWLITDTVAIDVIMVNNNLHIIKYFIKS